MSVVDSSACPKYFANGANASFIAGPIEDIDALVVPTISVLEGFKRVLQQCDESAALEPTAATQQGTVMEPGAEIALSPAVLTVDLKLPLADSIVLAVLGHRGNN